MRALLVGVPERDGLRYVGAVGTGLTERGRRDLARLLGSLAADSSPFIEPVENHWGSVRWARLDLAGEVEHAETTRSGLLRQASWKGIRGRHQE